MKEEINRTYFEIENKVLNYQIYEKIKDYSKNKEKMKTYLEIGQLINNIDIKYGESIIKEYSQRLSLKFGKKYSTSMLYKIKQFYKIIEKVPTLSGKLTWSHWYEMLSMSNINEVVYYVNLCETYNLDVRSLRMKIKSNEYERLPEDTRNKLIIKEESSVIDYVKNPIIIKNKNNCELITEKVLKKIILEDIENFMHELGSGYSFLGSEYKIKLGNRYNYIDLLLFNYKYNCFVVVELKVTELKKEHIGQIEIYMNYIDENIKTIKDNKTIGIIICKENNRYVIKYCSDKRIISRNYELV